jgi:hypothetical protein
LSQAADKEAKSLVTERGPTINPPMTENPTDKKTKIDDVDNDKEENDEESDGVRLVLVSRAMMG